jgi:hypothetical protein
MNSQDIVNNAIAKLTALRQKKLERLVLPAAEEISDYSISISDFMGELEKSTLNPNTPISVQQAFKAFLLAGEQLLMITQDHNNNVDNNNREVQKEIDELEQSFIVDTKNHVLRESNYYMAVSFSKLTEQQVSDVVQAFKALPFISVTVLENKVKGIYVREAQPYMADDVVRKLTEISGSCAKYVKGYMQKGPFSINGIDSFAEKSKQYV